MSLAPNAAEILTRHVELELECADRLYLNLYIPILQAPGGITYFWTKHRGYKFAPSALMAPMTRAFVEKVEQFVEREGIDVVTFRKGQRKDDVAHDYLAKFDAEEGVLFVGKAQEKTKVIRTERRYGAETGAPYAWLVYSTAMVNQYYFYCVDKDFGPFFIKFSSYFPYNGKLCINGHEYLKRQLEKRNVTFEALDNGIRSCENPKLMQKLAHELTPEKIDRFARKWFRKLPHPFPTADRAAGFRYDISILAVLQAHRRARPEEMAAAAKVAPLARLAWPEETAAAAPGPGPAATPGLRLAAAPALAERAKFALLRARKRCWYPWT